MDTLLVLITVFLTVVAAMAFGIFSAYAAISGILHAFGHRSGPEPTAVLIPSAQSGD